MKTQIDIVLSELKTRRRGITPQDMLKYGIMRLGDVVYKLRRRGVFIATVQERVINKITKRRSVYARYILKGWL